MNRPAGQVVACAVGLKGVSFIRGIMQQGIKPGMIVSYDQPDDASQSFRMIEALAQEASSEFIVSKSPQFSQDDLIFAVGWQYLFKEVMPFSVVFHDSLLPRYRGFSPTASALINGEPEIGVTALRPVSGVDEGPIVGQASVQVQYPIKIKEALEIQAGLMIDLAAQIYQQWREGGLSEQEQDHTRATYSLWRDDEDYLIDWSRPSSAILRMVDAVGFPYAGARTTINGETIIVDEASEVPDLTFEIRQPGKVWALVQGRPVVVCGSGLLRLDACRKSDGTPYEFKRLRVRMGA